MIDWIKCGDALPNDERFYLCWCSDDSFGLGFYTNKLSHEYKGNYRWVIGNEVNEKVIAWADFNRYKY